MNDSLHRTAQQILNGANRDASLILITGHLNFLASQVAIQYLMRSNNTVVRALHRDAGILEDFRELVRMASVEVEPKTSLVEAVSSRFELENVTFQSTTESSPEATAPALVADEVWHFAGTGEKPAKNYDSSRQIAWTLQQYKVAQLNCVLIPFTHSASHWLTDVDANGDPVLPETLGTAVAELCRGRNSGFRIFLTALLLAQHLPSKRLLLDGLVSVATTLYELKKEIDARHSHYFRHVPLRYIASTNASLNVIRADHAAELMVHTTEQPDTLNKHFYVCSPTITSFTDLCNNLSNTYGLTLLPVANSELLNDIDKLFRRRLSGFEANLSAPDVPEFQKLLCIADESENAGLGQQEQAKVFQALCRSQDADWQAKRERVAAMPGSMTERIVMQTGMPLLYYSAGYSQIPIILINALGQGLHYWYPLVDYLRRRHRVILWEQRGTVSPPHPFSLIDQLSDLEAILEHEGITECYLVPWCTGLKLSVAFYLRHPNMVPAMMVLNGSLHTVDTPQDLETVFEHNLGLVCQIVDKTPRMAATVKSLLASSLEDNALDLFAGLPADQVATSVLSQINADLRPHVAAPFRSETSTVNYCRQILDFKSYDPRSSVACIDIPIMFIGAEYDRLTSPVAVEHAAKLFPRGHYLYVPGATHYFVYDHAEMVGDLIEKFVVDPPAT